MLRYRTEHELTQTVFGRLVGMPQSHVALLEAGEHEPSLATLVKLSAALGVDFTLQINRAECGCATAPDQSPMRILN